MANLFTSQVPSLPNVFEGVPVTVGNTVEFAAAGSVRSRFLAPTTLGAGTYELALFRATAADANTDSGAGTELAAVAVPLASLTGGQWSGYVNLGAVNDTNTYVVALRTSEGRYAATVGLFTSALVSGPITAYQDRTNVPGLGIVYNGRFRSGLTGYPNQTFGSNGYFVDVEFTPTPAGGGTTPRPDTGTTGRPSSGITARPNSGITPRP